MYLLAGNELNSLCIEATAWTLPPGATVTPDTGRTSGCRTAALSPTRTTCPSSHSISATLAHRSTPRKDFTAETKLLHYYVTNISSIYILLVNVELTDDRIKIMPFFKLEEIVF